MIRSEIYFFHFFEASDLSMDGDENYDRFFDANLPRYYGLEKVVRMPSSPFSSEACNNRGDVDCTDDLIGRRWAGSGRQLEEKLSGLDQAEVAAAATSMDDILEEYQKTL